MYSKDSSGRSVPKQLLPAAYKSGTCLIDDFLDKNPEFAAKARTVNPAGRCTGSGGKTRTPAVHAPQHSVCSDPLVHGKRVECRVGRAVQACKASPTGARVGGKEAWHWDKISDDHPAKAEWFACPIPGVEESKWSGACIDGRTDPVSKFDSICTSSALLPAALLSSLLSLSCCCLRLSDSPAQCC